MATASDQRRASGRYLPDSPAAVILVPAVAALVIVIVAQMIGPWKITLGVAAVTVYPMVWGLIAGVVLAANPVVRFSPRMWRVADGLMAVSVALLVSLLSFTIGPNLKVLANAGPALLLQEFGHLFGTIALALPLAVALKMGRSTVGATFAIDREASFAIVGDKYGTQSEEYRGVLSMYVFGTMFGAVIVALIASVMSSLDWFDPMALAMGAGVGSASMMAAGAAAISGAHPEVAKEVLAMAGTSNLITMLLGTYVGVFIALPLADKLYRVLTRTPKVATLGAPAADPSALSAPKATTTETTAAETTTTEDDHAPAPVLPPVHVPLAVSIGIVSVIGIVSAMLAAKKFDPQILIGFGMMIALAVSATGLAKLVKGRIPMIIWASVLGTVVSSPWSPIQAFVLKAAASVNFLSFCAVVLTFAGLAMAANLGALRKVGWRIVPVGFVAIIASFLLSTIIAEFALGLG